jgi:hypothetical protein
MRDQTSKAFAARLPAERAKQVEAVLDRTGWSQSEFVRRALQFYTSQNPDRIPALYPEDSIQQLFAEMEVDDA